jgi:pyruvate dehydrogenase E2 component (dihydrolipoamide acetyltransferase)
MPDVLMPRLSDTMAEGTLSQWLKHEGDQVGKGDLLAVIETDKAAMEMEAYDEGVLTRILVEEGQAVPIGTPIAVIGEAAAGAPVPPPVPAPDETERSVVPPQYPHPPLERRPPGGCGPRRWPASSPASTASTWPPSAAPAPAGGSYAPTSRMPSASAAEPSMRLRRDPSRWPPAVTGPTASAPARPAVTLPATTAAPSVADAEADEIPLSTVRRLTAERLAASAREAPHFYLTVVADAGELLAFRTRLSERRGADVKISVTDLLIKACAAALAAHPEVNVSWDRTRILRHRHINI